jgi:hypothetical protein
MGCGKYVRSTLTKRKWNPERLTDDLPLTLECYVRGTVLQFKGGRLVCAFQTLVGSGTVVLF